MSQIIQKLKLRVGVFITVFVLAFSLCAMAEETKTSHENVAVKSGHDKWWKDAKFGLFINWNPSCLLGGEISWSRSAPRLGLEAKYNWPPYSGGIPVEIYDNLYKMFNPSQFDANEWVAITQAAGMKYIVFDVRHHDGFSMYDTKLDDYKITNTPFKRDITAELAKACSQRGMKLGLYYSQVNWHHPDWNAQNLDRYIEYMHGQVREICTNYGEVAILWFDGICGDGKIWQSKKLIEMIRKLQPDIMINDRSGDSSFDFNTAESHVGSWQIDHPWETCMTLGDNWNWKANDTLKPFEQCLKLLVNCTGSGGNFLLDVAPMPTGQFEPRQIEILTKMGDWLRKYGESIYGTRAGPFKPTACMVSTRKDDTIYVHVLDWQGSEVIHLSPIEKKIIASSLLTGGAVEVNQSDEVIKIRVPKDLQQEVDTIIVLKLNGPAADITPRDATPAKFVQVSDDRQKINEKKSQAAQTNLNRSPMKRYGMAIKVKPDKLESYKKEHAAVWPKVLEMISKCNIKNYSIYYKDGYLFSYFEYTGSDFDADMAKMAADPTTQKWWALCKPFQEPLPTRAEGEWWANMEEVFHLD